MSREAQAAPVNGEVPPPTPSWARQAGRTAVRAIGYAAGMIALLFLTFLALRIDPNIGLRALWTGAFGDAQSGHLYPISETLVETSPLLLTGLGVVVAWRAGLFSIGGEGQLLIGALAAIALGRLGSRLSPGIQTALLLVGGTAAGALWGWIAGWLRVRRNVQEVISTIMLNYIALYLVNWMVVGPLQEQAKIGPYSDPLPDAVLFARMITPDRNNGIATRLHSGVLIALAAAPVIWLLLSRTTSGFGMRLVGQNPEAARVGRFEVDRLRLRAMALSGALCGLAGGIELLGVSGRLAGNFSPGWGYTAIPVALLGGLHPAGTLFSALFFGALTAGCGNLERSSGVSATIIYIVQASAVLAVVGLRAWQARRSGLDTE